MVCRTSRDQLLDVRLRDADPDADFRHATAVVRIGPGEYGDLTFLDLAPRVTDVADQVFSIFIGHRVAGEVAGLHESSFPCLYSVRAVTPPSGDG